MDGFAGALRFDTTASDFVRGVEVGRLWEMLKNDGEPVEEIVHASNAEMLMRVGEASCRAVQREELGDGWLLVKFDAA